MGAGSVGVAHFSFVFLALSARRLALPIPNLWYINVMIADLGEQDFLVYNWAAD